MADDGQEKDPRFYPAETPERLALRADSLTFALAQTTDDLLQAYKLVYKSYLRAEYIDPHPCQMRYNVFNALPDTTTFVSKLGSKVVTTASIVFDSPLGLPMEIIYPDEIDVLRRDGARVCEVTMLADRRRAGIRTIPSILQIFRMVLHYAQDAAGATDICITINPSHEIFYTRYLPFTDLGGLRHYPSVKNAPALAKRANLHTLFEEHENHRLYEFFMDSETPERVFDTKKVFTPEEFRELFVLTRDVFPKLPAFAMDHIRSCYPDYDFDSILAPPEE